MLINKPQKQNKTNPLGAVATGVVIGAGIAAAGAVLLQDKKNSEKVKNVVKDVKKQVTSYMDDMQKKAQEKKVAAKNEVKKKTEATLNSAQDSIEQAKKNL